MKTIIKTIGCVFSLTYLFIANNVMAQQATDWFYCVITDDYNNAVYFTEAFSGNYDEIEDYQQRFLKQVMEKYGEDIDSDAFCSFEEEKSTLLAALEADKTDNQDFYEKVVTVPLQ